MFKIKIIILKNDKVITTQKYNGDRFSAVLRDIKKWLDELGPY